MDSLIENDSARHIRLLSTHVANKIAAGEVVERPASVVKELMENSLDAGATRITLNVTAGGRKLIEVEDDGCGMDRDDALLCIERQATSKIRDVDDIERIATYGFRGEAIPSIAAVSRFTLRTCRRGDPAGTEVQVIGGTLQDVRDIGAPPGTSIAVRDLFFNVPARRKFLRTYQTEQANLRTSFMLAALARPDVGMILRADGREIHNLPAGSTREERVRDLFGDELLAALRPVADIRFGVRVEGYVSLPTTTRAGTGEQYFFVNGRAVSAAILSHALREAYPPLEGDRRPVVLLFIEMDPGAVDVNVHPTKREVRFRRPAEVRDAVISAVCAALGTIPRHNAAAFEVPPQSRPANGDANAAAMASGADATPGQSFPPRTPFPAPAAPSGPLPANLPFPSCDDAASRVATQADQHIGVTLAPQAARPAGPDAPGAAGVEAPAPVETIAVPADARVTATSANSPWKWFRILGQIEGPYVLLETDGGFVTLDPRAAHERVLFERFMRAGKSEKAMSQRLLLPITVKLSPEDARRIRDSLAELRSMGFELDEFGRDGFIVEGLPPDVPQDSCREMLADIAHDLEQSGARRGREHRRGESVARAASRAALRGRAQLAPAELEQLIADLSRTKMPYTCPRGRPTMLFTSLRELNRKFGRD